MTSSSLMGEAARATSVLLSMKSRATPEQWISWFRTISEEMGRKMNEPLVPNTPQDYYDGPPHDEAPEPEPTPVEDSISMAFHDSGPF